MVKKSRFRGLFNKQHNKRGQTVLAFAWQHIYHIYWSLWRQLRCKKSLLEICKLIELFFNTLTADDRYYLLSKENLMQPIHIHFSQKQEICSERVSAFLKSRLYFNIFKKKISVIDDVCLKLQSPKNVVR